MGPASLDDILVLSRVMLAKAEAGAWDDLPELESRRGSMLAQYFDDLHGADPGASDSAGICSLREMNDRIIYLGKIQSQRLAREISENSRQRRAASRYRQYSAG
ncbi:MAG: flagellar protein FliT [Gammaproteobacteria bacterium]|nr:flagellar protein FliT [Gammaproteobacteria bacterium]